ncbi:MAG: thiamine pyrophosphate-binding protein [Fimbriimonadaceae bacterium]|nr:thiamine pyrophosphate-binding protein [Alphaproteobacteria bacterium]
MSDKPTVGAVITAFLEASGVNVAFGVISIHNMPILDAIAGRGNIRFVPSRGEAGAVNMADAATRVSNQMSVAITSTGTACGNAAGAMVEAQTAGTPLLHLTGQIEVDYLDRNVAYIHEARDQLSMLKSISKAAYRVTSPHEALAILKEAVAVANTAPTGPVSVEIPIDIQQATIDWPQDLSPHPVVVDEPDTSNLDMLAEKLVRAKRPLLWLGGGARGAGAPVRKLVDLGFGVITTTQGRGILPEGHAASLGAFTLQGSIEDFYQTCDAMLVVGSRLRGNETLKYTLKLPKPLYQIDADPASENRCYPCDHFYCGDAARTLDGLATRLAGKISIDPGFIADLDAARDAAQQAVRKSVGSYTDLISALQNHVGDDYLWVRDVTVSNSMWGNRMPCISDPRNGVHALGGGIGQGLQMAIGAALAGRGCKTVCLVGDGGLQLNIGELATAAQEQPDMLTLIMNSAGYEVIKNIQDAYYGGRHHYVDILTPDFAQICAAVGIPHQRLSVLDDIDRIIGTALTQKGPRVIEIDMKAVGPFYQAFAGPPVRKAI